MLAPVPDPRPDSVPPVAPIETPVPPPRLASVPVPVAALCLGVMSLGVLGGLGFLIRDGKSALDALANAPARLLAAGEPAPIARFDRQSATAALAIAVPAAAEACGLLAPPGLTSPLRVTFLPDGALDAAELAEGTFAGTHQSECIGARLRGLRVPPFSGGPVTLLQSVALRTTQPPRPSLQ